MIPVAYAHMYGDENIKKNISNALNHTELTNNKTYQSTVREMKVTSTKMAVKKLQYSRFKDIKKTLQVGTQSQKLNASTKTSANKSKDILPR